MSKVLNYTIESDDPNNYSLIQTWLPNPATPFTKLTVTALTTQCSIVVLDQDDYIAIDGRKYYVDEEYSNLNAESVVGILERMLLGSGVEVNLLPSNRLEFSANHYFIIDDATYNMKLVTGLYNTEFPVSTDGMYSVRSVGFYLSTPILYLLCNIGSPCFISKGEVCKNQSIVMRINNSFSSAQPIIANNAEFSSIMQSNSLSDIRFKLVDANFRDIKILSPIYISAYGEGLDRAWEVEPQEEKQIS